MQPEPMPIRTIGVAEDVYDGYGLATDRTRVSPSSSSEATVDWRDGFGSLDRGAMDGAQ